jgi:hypothetical protein
MIPFNLACYASVAGRMEEAKARLRHAIDLDKGARNSIGVNKEVQKLAVKQRDLKPLREWTTDLQNFKSHAEIILACQRGKVWVTSPRL